MISGNEIQMNVGRYASEDIVWTSGEIPEQFFNAHEERHGVANHVNTSPNSLGRLDRHKIGFIHKQMNPSMIGKIDFIESSKDVGQSGTISPYADVSVFSDVNVNKYPNIKFDLYKFIEKEFPTRAVVFGANDIIEYNQILDKMVMSVYMDVDYHIKPKEAS